MPFVLGACASSEFDIQALLWTELQKAGYMVRGEVRGSLQNEKRLLIGNKVRLDLVVFNSNNEPTLAIEVKPKRSRAWRDTFLLSRQCLAYTLLGFPVVMTCGKTQALQLLDRMPWALSLQAGVHWLD
ncbi:MAG: hypothetical protein IPK42_10565 [Betaproteobacteria bacterium]|nr:hypothetical protein [Betaproteobacteria bacterium]